MHQLVIIEWRLDATASTKPLHLTVGALVPHAQQSGHHHLHAHPSGAHFQHLWDHTRRTFAFQMGAPCALFETLGASTSTLQHMVQTCWFHQLYLAPLDLQIDYALYGITKPLLAEHASALMRFKHMHAHPEDRLWDTLFCALEESLLVKPMCLQSMLPQGFSSFLPTSEDQHHIEHLLNAQQQPDASAFFSYIERTLLQQHVNTPTLMSPPSFVRRL